MTEMERITIDPEFARHLPGRTQEEFDGLREILMAEGILKPLSLWGNILLDGHHRYRIAREEGLPFDTVQVIGVSTRDEAIAWIEKNQLDGNRNLTDAERSYYRGREYERTKKPAHRPSGNSEKISELFTDAAIGAVHGVTGRTIRNDAEYARAVDSVMDSTGLGLADIAGPEAGWTKKAVIETAEADEETRQAIADDVRAGIPGKEAVKKHVHVSANSGENEWYTPAEYIEAARDVMGGIDMDPASSEIANRTVRATTYYTKDDDGLAQPWRGRIWMNPPYAQPLISQFAEKFDAVWRRGSVEQAIILVNNATETKWFQLMASRCDAICFPRGRIRFVDMDGNPSGTPLQGQAILYFGENLEAFSVVFGDEERIGGVIMHGPGCPLRRKA